jgi:hypothetical protein
MHRDNKLNNKTSMKKIIAISLLTVCLAASSAFGQGYFLFTSGKSQVYDGFSTPGVSTPAATVDTAFLWAPANTTPSVDSIWTSVPTTANSTTYNPNPFLVTEAWSDILNGQFTLAVNNTTSALVTQLSNANGSVIYNSGGTFPVTGTTTNTTYTVYMIGWDAHYATPALAAAANGGLGAAVGWSLPFQYTSGQFFYTLTSIIPANNNFGTFGPVPEPATLALSALGGLSLLAFRHRKKWPLSRNHAIKIGR